MEDRETIENTKCEIVKEVREIRHKISARFDHDVGRMVAHFQEMQEGYAGLGALQASAQTYREGIDCWDINDFMQKNTLLYHINVIFLVYIFRYVIVKK